MDHNGSYGHHDPFLNKLMDQAEVEYPVTLIFKDFKAIINDPNLKAMRNELNRLLDLECDKKSRNTITVSGYDQGVLDSAQLLSIIQKYDGNASSA